MLGMNKCMPRFLQPPATRYHLGLPPWSCIMRLAISSFRHCWSRSSCSFSSYHAMMQKWFRDPIRNKHLVWNILEVLCCVLFHLCFGHHAWLRLDSCSYNSCMSQCSWLMSSCQQDPIVPFILQISYHIIFMNTVPLCRYINEVNMALHLALAHVFPPFPPFPKSAFRHLSPDLGLFTWSHVSLFLCCCFSVQRGGIP